MSLLMQALKKAEQAKQEQAREVLAECDTPAAAPEADQSISLVPFDTGQEVQVELSQLAAPAPYPALHEAYALSSQASAEVEPAPLDFGLVPASEAARPLELTEVPAPPAAAPTSTPVAAPYAEPQEPAKAAPASPPARGIAEVRREQEREEKKARAAQGKARTVFAAKQRASRRVAWIAGGGIAALVGVAIGGYVWYQSMNVGSGIVPIQTMAPLAGETIAEADAANAPTPPQETVATPDPVPAIALAAPTSMDAAPLARATATSSATSAPPPGMSEPRMETIAAPMAEPAGIQFRRGVTATQINPALTQAYQAFMGGDIEGAEKHYRSALRQDPNSRDALLGMAAIAVKREKWDQAGGHYLRLLEADPADPEAIAGLLGLQHGDPVQSESRLKKALAQHPHSGALSFALGNLYAQQSRWNEAQQAYFGAYTGNPDSADYAFNLAVSLDRLDQSRLALEYYQKALTLAARGPAAFLAATVQARIGELRAAQ